MLLSLNDEDVNFLFRIFFPVDTFCLVHREPRIFERSFVAVVAIVVIVEKEEYIQIQCKAFLLLRFLL